MKITIRDYCYFILFLIFVFLLFTIIFPSELEEDDDYDYHKDIINVEGFSHSNTCWVPEGRNSCAPIFIIAGAKRGGGDIAYSLLMQHPEYQKFHNLTIDDKKTRTVINKRETRFFTDATWTHILDQYSDDNDVIRFYFDVFEHIEPPSNSSEGEADWEKRFTGEISESYSESHWVPRRIAKFLPNVKVLIFLRNPIDRTYSEYLFRKRIEFIEKGEENDEITEEERFMNCARVQNYILQLCNNRNYNFYRQAKRVEICYTSFMKYGSEATQFIQNITNCDDSNMHDANEFYRTYSEMSLGDQKNDQKEEEENEEEEGEEKENFRLKKVNFQLKSGKCKQFDYFLECPPRMMFDSAYAFFVNNFRHDLARRNVMYINSDEFFLDPTSVMTEISSFIGISEFDWEYLLLNLTVDNNNTQNNNNNNVIVNVNNNDDENDKNDNSFKFSIFDIITTNSSRKNDNFFAKFAIDEHFRELKHENLEELSSFFAPFHPLIARMANNNFTTWPQ